MTVVCSGGTTFVSTLWCWGYNSSCVFFVRWYEFLYISCFYFRDSFSGVFFSLSHFICTFCPYIHNSTLVIYANEKKKIDAKRQRVKKKSYTTSFWWSHRRRIVKDGKDEWTSTLKWLVFFCHLPRHMLCHFTCDGYKSRFVRNFSGKYQSTCDH